MKKIISLVLATVMLLTILVGCGNVAPTPTPTPEKELDLTELREAMMNAVGNAPENFRYENFSTDDLGTPYIERIQYRDGDKLKYWDYRTGKYIKGKYVLEGYWEYTYDYSKKTEADIKEDEWMYREYGDYDFYVIYIGWGDNYTSVTSYFDDIKRGRLKFVKAENGVYGSYFCGGGNLSEIVLGYSEDCVDNKIVTKSYIFEVDEKGIKTDKISGWETQTMFGEVSFEIPAGK